MSQDNKHGNPQATMRRAKGHNFSENAPQVPVLPQILPGQVPLRSPVSRPPLSPTAIAPAPAPSAKPAIQASDPTVLTAIRVNAGTGTQTIREAIMSQASLHESKNAFSGWMEQQPAPTSPRNANVNASAAVPELGVGRRAMHPDVAAHFAGVQSFINSQLDEIVPSPIPPKNSDIPKPITPNVNTNPFAVGAVAPAVDKPAKKEPAAQAESGLDMSNPFIALSTIKVEEPAKPQEKPKAKSPSAAATPAVEAKSKPVPPVVPSAVAPGQETLRLASALSKAQLQQQLSAIQAATAAAELAAAQAKAAAAAVASAPVAPAAAPDSQFVRKIAVEAFKRGVKAGEAKAKEIGVKGSGKKYLSIRLAQPDKDTLMCDFTRDQLAKGLIKIACEYFNQKQAITVGKIIEVQNVQLTQRSLIPDKYDMLSLKIAEALKYTKFYTSGTYLPFPGWKNDDASKDFRRATFNLMYPFMNKIGEALAQLSVVDPRSREVGADALFSYDMGKSDGGKIPDHISLNTKSSMLIPANMAKLIDEQYALALAESAEVTYGSVTVTRADPRAR